MKTENNNNKHCAVENNQTLAMIGSSVLFPTFPFLTSFMCRTMRYSLLVNSNHFLYILAPLCIPLAYLPYVVAESAVTSTDRDILVKEVPRNVLLHRFKRTIGPNSTGLTDEEKETILKLHNDFRSSVKAGNMIKLEWDNRLEDVAQNYTDRCKFGSSREDYRRNKAGFNFIGENIFASNHVFKPKLFVQMWYDTVNFYTYNNNSCPWGKHCETYTQIVWATTKAIGCGYTFCSPFSGHTFSPGYYLVCHYGEAGSIPGQKPFIKGEVCSACPKEMKFCTKNFCSNETSSPSTSTSGMDDRILNANDLLMLTMAFCLYIILI